MLANRLKELRKARGLTLDALADRLGTSKQTIHRYENGVISNIPHDKVRALARALEVAPSELMGWEQEELMEGTSVKRLPLLGEIACGVPTLADERRDSYIYVGASTDADFCLTAHGDSMVDARIFDGDIVFIKSQSSVDNGEIAAVIIDDEATLKRVYFYPAEGKLILSPENPKYAPLVYINEELERVRILGKAVAFQSTVV